MKPTKEQIDEILKKVYHIKELNPNGYISTLDLKIINTTWQKAQKEILDIIKELRLPHAGFIILKIQEELECRSKE
jgi:hypothetical protein